MDATDDLDELAIFTFDAQGCGTLDTACTSNVAGKKWLKSYKKLLGKYKDRVIFEGVPNRKFKFGTR